MESLKERKIYSRLKQKDKDAFIEVYDLFVDKLYRFVYFKVGNKEEAEDLVSQSFLKAWNHILENKVSDEKTLKALIYRIARNAVIDHYRKAANQNETFLSDSDECEQIADDSAEGMIGEIDSSFDRREIEKKLLQIKDEYREIIILKFIEDFSVGEIAEILDKPKGAVRVLAHRALKALRVLYGQDEKEI